MRNKWEKPQLDNNFLTPVLHMGVKPSPMLRICDFGSDLCAKRGPEIVPWATVTAMSGPPDGRNTGCSASHTSAGTIRCLDTRLIDERTRWSTLELPCGSLGCLPLPLV